MKNNFPLHCQQDKCGFLQNKRVLKRILIQAILSITGKSRKGVCNKMCFCFWRPADKLGFNVGWIDYKLPSISSETKYFAGDKQDQETFHWTKNNDSTYNFISILEGQQQENLNNVLCSWTWQVSGNSHLVQIPQPLLTLMYCPGCWHLVVLRCYWHKSLHHLDFVFPLIHSRRDAASLGHAAPLSSDPGSYSQLWKCTGRQPRVSQHRLTRDMGHCTAFILNTASKLQKY